MIRYRSLFAPPALALALYGIVAAAPATDDAQAPNLVVVLADDLGYGDPGCFGQKLLQTPRLDQMAAEGLRFTQFYAGGTDTGTSRGVLMTGRHGGRTAVRENSGDPVDPGPTVATMLATAGYRTASIDASASAAPDLIAAEALRFIRENKDGPLFLHFAMNAPDPGGQKMAVPDPGGLAAKDWPQPEKEFAAIIRNMDQATGRLLDLLDELGIAENTLVLFTSDNGPPRESGHDPEFFDSNGPYRGVKGDLSEGGIRVPAIARWPGTIEPASENKHQWYVGDLMATAAELAGVEPPADLDSDSLLPTLRGNPPEKEWHRKSVLYWESAEGETAQAVRFGKWKALRSPMVTGAIELYDLSWDYAESRDHAGRRPQLAEHAANLFSKQHQPDPSAEDR